MTPVRTIRWFHVDKKCSTGCRIQRSQLRTGKLPRRIRKLLGTVVLVLYVVAYSLVVMKLASATLPTVGGWGQLGFYVFFGLIWVVPAGAIVWWMQRPGAQGR